MNNWVDHLGVTRPVPASRNRLQFRKPLHAALRAFVFFRDGFACRACGGVVERVPSAYDGKETLWLVQHPGMSRKTFLILDHVLTQPAGGTHHPSNLQALCETCNKVKGGTIDRDSRKFREIPGASNNTKKD